MPGLRNALKNVLVLGGSYGGIRAATVLAQELPAGYRVLMVEKQSHFNHLYIFPRCYVVPGHEHKAFIPYADLNVSSEHNDYNGPPLISSLPPSVEEDYSAYGEDLFISPPPSPLDFGPHHILHATVRSIHPSHVTLSRSFPEYGFREDIPYEFLVYALGSIMPKPLVLPPDTLRKLTGIAWMVTKQDELRRANHVVVVGGGALGIQFASDLAEHRKIHVTLIHSSNRLLPRFDPRMHDLVLPHLTERGVEVVLNDRLQSLVIQSGHIVTEKGAKIACDLLLRCTGQSPNTSLIASSFAAPCLNPESRLTTVSRTMQMRPFSLPMTSPPSEQYRPGSYSNMFAIGDAADALGAIKAGHTAHLQADVAARNIVLLAKKTLGMEYGTPLLEYTPGPPGIKLTVGLRKIIFQAGADIEEQDCEEDLDAAGFWKLLGADPSDMWR